MSALEGFTVHATDGDVGTLQDLYFDDQEWKIRYLVVGTGPWLLGRQVLLAPLCVDLVRWQMRELIVDLTREQVEKSPEVDLAQPVSRQMEAKLHQYYRWAPYWRTGARALAAAQAEEATAADEASEAERRAGAPALRSAQEVAGYDIQASDGEIGHIDDFFIDVTYWAIRYLLVDTRDWLPGKQVLVSREWLQAIDWARSQARVGLTRQEIKSSPEYDPDVPVARSYEVELYEHYGVPGYWLQKPYA
jgi:hypothetical protein